MSCVLNLDSHALKGVKGLIPELSSLSYPCDVIWCKQTQRVGTPQMLYELVEVFLTSLLAEREALYAQALERVKTYTDT
jgi:hypothetical protein